MPEYQLDAVSPFLDNFKTSRPQDIRKLNLGGRAFPDISAQATGITVVVGGTKIRGVAGNSLRTFGKSKIK